MNIWQKRAPGVLLCLAVALLAWFLVELAPALEIVGSAVLAILPTCSNSSSAFSFFFF